MRLLTVVFLSLFAFGCHEYSVEPLPINPTPPSESIDFITLKGPGVVSMGERPSYLAQFHKDAVRYRFQLTSPSAPVMQSIDPDDDRRFYAEVIGEGIVEIKVTAYDIRDERVATSMITVESR